MTTPDPELAEAERRYREHVDQMRAPWGEDALIVLAEYDRRAEEITGLRGVLDLEEAAHEATAREVARLEAENADQLEGRELEQHALRNALGHIQALEAELARSRAVVAAAEALAAELALVPGSWADRAVEALGDDVWDQVESLVAAVRAHREGGTDA